MLDDLTSQMGIEANTERGLVALINRTVNNPQWPNNTDDGAHEPKGLERTKP